MFLFSILSKEDLILSLMNKVSPKISLNSLDNSLPGPVLGVGCIVIEAAAHMIRELFIRANGFGLG